MSQPQPAEIVGPGGTRVVPMPWDRFGDWFAGQWQPGQHVALIGPTGSGKSTFAVGVLPRRRWVLAMDPKGGDSTLATLQSAGFVRIEKWPPPRAILRDVEEGKPARLIVGPVVRSRADLPRLRQVIADALDGAFDHGGWTVYIDELGVAADRRLMNLGGPIDRNLIAARDRKVSMVTSYQRPANVPRAAADQATWLAVWFTRDVDVQNRLAEMVGRPRAEIRGAMRGLDPKTILLFSQDPTHPIIATRAPRVR